MSKQRTPAEHALDHLMQACQMINADTSFSEICANALHTARQHTKALVNLMNSKDKTNPLAASDFLKHALENLAIVERQRSQKIQQFKADHWSLIKSAKTFLTEYKESV